MGTEVPSWGRGCSHRSPGRVFNENQILMGDTGDENIMGSSHFISAAEIKCPDKKQLRRPRGSFHLRVAGCSPSLLRATPHPFVAEQQMYAR